MRSFALVAVALAASGCPAPIPLECLSCDSGEQCAPDGLACVGGYCEGATPCTVPDAGTPSVLFADDFETGTLLKSETPAGRWDDKLTFGAATADETMAPLPEAAIGGSYGLSVKDTGTFIGDMFGTGLGLISGVDASAASSLHLRYHARITSRSGQLGPFPIELHGNVPNSTVGEMALAGDGIAGLKCGGQMNPDAPCVKQGHFTTDTWHTVRISMEGLGQALGSCTWWLDDELVCTQPVDWRSTLVDTVLGGAPVVNSSWHGELSMDDVTLSQDAPPPHRLYLAGPLRVVRGRCTPFSLQAEGRLQPVADVSISLTGAHAFSDAACSGAEATGFTLAVGKTLEPLWLRFDDLGDATVTATDVGSGDVLPDSHTVSVVAPGCGAAPGAPAVLLALVASMRRRTRRLV